MYRINKESRGPVPDPDDILDDIENKIKNHYLLSKIYEGDEEQLNYLAAEYGDEPVLQGKELVDIFKKLKSMVNSRGKY